MHWQFRGGVDRFLLTGQSRSEGTCLDIWHLSIGPASNVGTVGRGPWDPSEDGGRWAQCNVGFSKSVAILAQILPSRGRVLVSSSAISLFCRSGCAPSHNCFSLRLHLVKRDLGSTTAMPASDLGGTARMTVFLVLLVFVHGQLVVARRPDTDEAGGGGDYFWRFVVLLLGMALVAVFVMGFLLGMAFSRTRPLTHGDTKTQGSMTVLQLGSKTLPVSTWLGTEAPASSMAAAASSMAAASTAPPNLTWLQEVLYHTKTSDTLHVRGCSHLRTTPIEQKVCKDCIRRVLR